MNQIAEFRKFSALSRPEEPAVVMESGPSGKETVQEALAKLRAKYTDKHPEVLALKKRLEDEGQGEGKGTGQAQSPAARETRRARTDRGFVSPTDTTIATLQAQLMAADSEIRQLRVEEEKIRVRVREYEQRIEGAPKREQEMTSLMRDYENTKKFYDALLGKKLDSEQARAMEQRQQGEQFRIIDPADLPAKPWKPDILKLLALSLAGGLGVGVGLALLMEYLDRSFKDPEDLQAFAGLSVLAVVPRIELEQEKEPHKGKVRAMKRKAQSA
jgi:uncharacterized protein involved in exopolysaccharide biosynthesis